MGQQFREGGRKPGEQREHETSVKDKVCVTLEGGGDVVWSAGAEEEKDWRRSFI